MGLAIAVSTKAADQNVIDVPAPVRVCTKKSAKTARRQHRVSQPFPSLVFDIETTGLDPHFSAMLCWVAYSTSSGKWYRWSQLDRPRIFERNREFDRDGAARLAELCTTHVCLIAHNGRFFDLPFLRCRLLRWGLGSLPAKMVLDPFLVARRYLCSTRAGLGSLASLCQRSSKQAVSPNLWRMATLAGDVPAMRKVESHCRKDVELLAEVCNLVSPYVDALRLP